MHQSINAIKETYWCSLGDGVGPLPTPSSLCRSISKSIVHTKFIAIHNFVSCTIDCSEFCTIKWTIYKSYFQIWIPTAEPLVSASAIPRTEQRALTSSVLTTAPYQSHHLLLTPSSSFIYAYVIAKYSTIGNTKWFAKRFAISWTSQPIIYPFLYS